MARRRDIVVLGLSITSSWGNGHATTYRALIKGLGQRGHRVLFLERDQPWYAAHRDLPQPRFCELGMYDSLEALDRQFAARVEQAELVILGSYVPDGISVAQWMLEHARGTTAWYDIDTPITLAALKRNECAYLRADLIPEFDLFLTFTGGPLLERLEQEYGARGAAALYCSVDTDSYYPTSRATRSIDLGYMGTYSVDRQPKLDSLLLAPACAWKSGHFVVVGPGYPAEIEWPPNVARIEHLPPAGHRRFYNSQRFTLNVTRADMVEVGYAPSVRLFEAAACGVPVISDSWPGLDDLFAPDQEILLAETPADVLGFLQDIPETERARIGARARERVLAAHSGEQRAAELEQILEALPERGATAV
ncbi:glycosyltransferase [soil metagenome]